MYDRNASCLYTRGTLCTLCAAPITHKEKTRGFERGTLKKDTVEHMDQNQNSQKKCETHPTELKLKQDMVAAQFF